MRGAGRSPALRAGWMRGAVQGFADVDIAKTCDNMLIQQGGFDRGVATLEPRDEVVFVKTIAKRFRAKSRQQGVAVGAGGGHQVHRAEAAGIVEGDAGAVFHIEHDMVMLFGRGMVVVPFTQRFARIRR